MPGRAKNLPAPLYVGRNVIYASFFLSYLNVTLIFSADFSRSAQMSHFIKIRARGGTHCSFADRRALRTQDMRDFPVRYTATVLWRVQLACHVLLSWFTGFSFARLRLWRASLKSDKITRKRHTVSAYVSSSSSSRSQLHLLRLFVI